jgi:nucleoside-diphosphate-sugar epimerase
MTAHHVNVEGTLRLLEFAQKEGESHGRPVVFLYPSSIAAYGLPDLETKSRAGRVAEDLWNAPATMYGCNKLYCEQLGRYYSQHYKQLAAENLAGKVDFPERALPGPDLGRHGAVRRDLGLRAGDAARGGAARALRLLRAARHAHPVHGDARCRRGALAARAAPKPALSRSVYNVGAFNPSAEEIRDARHGGLPREPRSRSRRTRSASASSTPGPADVDDSAARRDWGFAPRYDEARAFSEYLVPTIRERYR